MAFFPRHSVQAGRPCDGSILFRLGGRYLPELPRRRSGSRLRSATSAGLTRVAAGQRVPIPSDPIRLRLGNLGASTVAVKHETRSALGSCAGRTEIRQQEAANLEKKEGSNEVQAE